jgi:hypothetical protein
MKVLALKVILFLPAVLIDGIFLGLIAFPLWLFCDVDPTTHNPIMGWLIELKNKK